MKIIIILAFLVATASNGYAAQISSSNNLLIGTINTKCISFQEANSGRTIKLSYPARNKLYPNAIKIEGGQTNLNISALFSSGGPARLDQDLVSFDVGYNDGLEKDTNRYCIGQFDFDKDGVLELLVAVIDPNYEDMTGVSVNILSYHPPSRTADLLRIQNWQLIGNLTVPNVLGDATINVKDRSVTIPRNLRGFYHEITWVKGRFVDTGDY